MARVEYGLQMYSLRDVTKENMKDALRQVAEMGYKYVEFAGFFGHTAEQIKAWLDEYGLICSGTHTHAGDITAEKIDETIAFHKTIGCQNLILPSADWSSEEAMDKTIALLNEAQPKLAAAGIALGYHNHSLEFLPGPYGKVIENEVIARTSIELEIDTFWAYNAGLDPVALCESLKHRIRVIHLKDGLVSAPECKTYEACYTGVSGKSTGMGQAPVQAVREWAIANGVLMVIESEGLDPTGPAEVKRCIDYLRTLD